jgi:HEAT repeat protein
VLLLASAAWAVDGDLKKQVKDPDSFKRSDAARALAKDGSPAAAKLLVELLSDKNPYVRDHTVGACAKLRDADSIAVIAKAARTKDVRLRADIAEALGGTNDDAALDALEKLVTGDREPGVRAAALDALWGYRESERVNEIATRAAQDDDASVRASAVEAVGRMRGASAADVAIAALDDADEGVRCVARMELRFVAKGRAVEDLAVAAADPGWRTRAQAVENAWALRDATSMDTLCTLVGDERLRVAASAQAALIGLTGKEFGRDADVWRSWWEANKDGWQAPDEPQLGVAPADSDEGTRAVYHGLEILSDHVVFVLDASGSMREKLGTGTRWDYARKELETALAALPDGTLVNVIVFQEQARAAFDAPKPLGKKTRRDLSSFARKTTPGDAGNLLAGMLAALDQGDTDTVYLLSDGAPSFGDMVLKSRVRSAIRAQNRMRKFVINGIGLGAEKSTERSFLQGLARDSGGRVIFK